MHNGGASSAVSTETKTLPCLNQSGASVWIRRDFPLGALVPSHMQVRRNESSPIAVNGLHVFVRL